MTGFLLIALGGVSLAQNSCPLNSPSGRVKHVIYVQFDNTHFVRDNPNVPSDLEQMPHLLKPRDAPHQPSHASHFPHRHGHPHVPDRRLWGPARCASEQQFPLFQFGWGVSFAYWTAPLFDPTTSTPTDTTFNMLTADGNNAPAPWVAFTRAGCNVGGVATASRAAREGA